MTPTHNVELKEKSPNATHLKSRAGRNKNQYQGESLRGRWMNRYEHYCGLAQKTGNMDAVVREQYWQHAEHFLRLMNGSA